MKWSRDTFKIKIIYIKTIHVHLFGDNINMINNRALIWYTMIWQKNEIILIKLSNKNLSKKKTF